MTVTHQDIAQGLKSLTTILRSLSDYPADPQTLKQAKSELVRIERNIRQYKGPEDLKPQLVLIDECFAMISYSIHHPPRSLIMHTLVFMTWDMLTLFHHFQVNFLTSTYPQFK